MSVAPPPQFQTSPFTCPHCGVVAQQKWVNMASGTSRDEDAMRTTCVSCRKHAYWVWGQLVAPAVPLGPPPNEDLDGDLLEIYREAREVAGRSPRAAAALLRLLVERLVHELDAEGHEGESLQVKIRRMRDAGRIDSGIYEAMVAVKVAGDGAVHAGQIDPNVDDQAEVVTGLFLIVNHIVTSTRSVHREVEAIRKAQEKARSEKGKRIKQQKRDAVPAAADPQ